MGPYHTRVSLWTLELERGPVRAHELGPCLMCCLMMQAREHDQSVLFLG